MIYKIIPRILWQEAEKIGVFYGSAVDSIDGYIHFSSAEQVKDTARKHFSGQCDLLLIAVDWRGLGAELKWEPSRGGALFPHLYGALDLKLVASVVPLLQGIDGHHQFPEGIL